jgi:hypothetical protein
MYNIYICICMYVYVYIGVILRRDSLPSNVHPSLQSGGSQGTTSQFNHWPAAHVRRVRQMWHVRDYISHLPNFLNPPPRLSPLYHLTPPFFPHSSSPPAQFYGIPDAPFKLYVYIHIYIHTHIWICMYTPPPFCPPAQVLLGAARERFCGGSWQRFTGNWGLGFNLGLGLSPES